MSISGKSTSLVLSLSSVCLRVHTHITHPESVIDSIGASRQNTRARTHKTHHAPPTHKHTPGWAGAALESNEIPHRSNLSSRASSRVHATAQASNDRAASTICDTRDRDEAKPNAQSRPRAPTGLRHLLLRSLSRRQANNYITSNGQSSIMTKIYYSMISP